MINGYFLAYFFVESLDGNVFVNAITLGTSEVIAMFWSGVLLLKVKEDTAFRICSLLAFFASMALPFGTSQTMTVIILFFAVSGLGGMYNSGYVIIEMQLSPKTLGYSM